MNAEEEDIVLIEKYLEGRLRKDELEAFEKRRKGDEMFDQSVKDLIILTEGIRLTEREKNLNFLKEVEASLPTVKKETKIFSLNSYKTWGLVAASISVMIISSIFIFNKNRETESVDLFNQYFSPYPNIVLYTARSEAFPTSIREQAYRAYDNKDYKNVITFLGSETEKNPEDMFYLANAYLATGQTRKAIAIFEKLQKLSSFNSQVKWYLGLSYLKEGNLDKARPLMEEIRKSKTSYSWKAKGILEEME